MKTAQIFVLLLAIFIKVHAQINIIWNIPTTEAQTGSTASISAAFVNSLTTTLYSIYIVSSTGDIVDVVASNQLGAGAAEVWRISANFPPGTYQVRVDANDNGVVTSNIGPKTITVSAVSRSDTSNCSVAAFKAQTPSDFSTIQVIAPRAGTLVGLPPVGSSAEGRFNVEYYWKLSDVANGWNGATSLFIDVLAIENAEIPGESQTPTATVAHTTVIPPTVSTKIAPIIIPTIAAIKDHLGPAVIRVNYNIGNGVVKSAYSQNFFLGHDCTGVSIGEGNTNSTFTSPGASPGIVVDVNTGSALIGIIVGVAVGAVVLTACSIFLVLYFLKRRRTARKRAENY